MTKSVNKLPSAMAIQRSLVLSDALFYNEMDKGSETPLLVVEHGLRGTQNVNTEKGHDKDIANPQRTESAKMDPSARRLLVRFHLRAAPLSEAISMCAEPGGGKAGRELGKDMRSAIASFIAQAIASGATMDLGLRYARNILNGRWLWRNRSYAQSIEVRVFELNGKEKNLVARASSLDVPMGHFNKPTAEEKAIADVLARGWNGDAQAPGVCVEASVDFGVSGSVEVYPSQNYTVKHRGFARSLYKLPLHVAVPSLGSGIDVLGHAALRDQKVGNALRTIDTWYSDFDEQGTVTPVEPMGANLALADFLRGKKETAFELLKDIGITNPQSPTGQFLLAILVRGGVFGEKTKKEASEAGEGSSDEPADTVEGA